MLSSCYYMTQGYYLLKYTNSALPIEDILKQDNISDKTRVFLNNALDIRSFIQEKVHLVTDKNYTRYKELNQNYLVLVVQAAPKTSIEPYLWKYPFFGKLPYRGYYKKKDAEAEEQRLKKKGLDTYIRKVGAFSTLRILSDPLYSFMQNYHIGNLAELISHEQTHATIWVSKESSFNEQFATFVGRESAKMYLAQRFGEDSDTYKSYFNIREDGQRFSAFLNEVKDALLAVYENESLSDEEKIEQRQEVLNEYQKGFETSRVQAYKTQRYKKANITGLNNAFFALISVYEENLDLFSDAYVRCGSNLGLFVNEMKKITKAPAKRLFRKKPFDFVKGLCKT